MELAHSGQTNFLIEESLTSLSIFGDRTSAIEVHRNGGTDSANVRGGRDSDPQFEKYKRRIAAMAARSHTPVVSESEAGFSKEADLEVSDRYLKAPKERILGKAVKIPEIHNIVATLMMLVNSHPLEVMRKSGNNEFKEPRFKAVISRDLEGNPTYLVSKNGSVVCCGTNSVDAAKFALHTLRYKWLAMGMDADFNQVSIDNRVVVGSIGHKIKLAGVRYADRIGCVFMPEKFPGLIYIMYDPRIVTVIFGTGKYTALGVRDEQEIMAVFEHIMPILDANKCTAEEAAKARLVARAASSSKKKAEAATATQAAAVASRGAKRKAAGAVTEEDPTSFTGTKAKRKVKSLLSRGRRTLYELLRYAQSPEEAERLVNRLMVDLANSEKAPLASAVAEAAAAEAEAGGVPLPKKKKRGRKPKHEQPPVDPTLPPPEVKRLRVDRRLVSDFEADFIPVARNDETRARLSQTNQFGDDDREIPRTEDEDKHMENLVEALVMQELGEETGGADASDTDEGKGDTSSDGYSSGDMASSDGTSAKAIASVLQNLDIV